MKKQVQRNENMITSRAVNVKHQKNEQKSDSSCITNGFESNFLNKNSVKLSEESFNKSNTVLERYGHETTNKEDTNTNYHHVHNQVTKTNVMDSSVSLSSPGLCSALQLANEIQLASIELIKPKQCNKPLQRSEKHNPKVVRKANIPLSKQIFRNLVDLQINYDDIVPGRSVKTKNAIYDKKCDSTFIMENFYKPSFSSQCCAQIHKKKVDVEKVQSYNGVDMYNYTELFNSL